MPDGNLSVTVNGAERPISSPPETPLLEVLREELGLRATRFGCGQGACGACMVLLDGAPVPSCDMPVSEADGRRVETAESLDGPDGAHPVMRALVAHQAGQCGYCLPGIAMTAVGLLRANPAPSGAEIREALDGNLCRCGAHPRILRAIADAAAEAGADR